MELCSNPRPQHPAQMQLLRSQENHHYSNSQGQEQASQCMMAREQKGL